MRLKDKIAVITGGASGLGEASVYSFLKEGASVVIADFNEATGKETLVKRERLIVIMLTLSRSTLRLNPI